MKRLFNFAGRAWSFITKHLASDNFVIDNVGQVTKFMQQAEVQLKETN